MKKALITGVTGQDGSYLAELLLYEGYEVHGLIRRSSSFNTGRIDHIYQDPHDENYSFILHYGDLSNGEQLTNLIYNIKPDEIYHLGAQSHVRVSFDMPIYTGDVTGLGTARILEAIRRSGIKTRCYVACSSEMFGSSPPPQNENTPFSPRSPYGVAKLYSYWMAKNYREGYNLFISNGILFNHGSSRRKETFVTRKITRGITKLLSREQEYLYLGNLEAKRDWGYAPNFVEAMSLMLQKDEPDDYVIGTGESHSIKEFLKEAFSYVNLDWQDYVRIDKKYYRPTEVDILLADFTKARKELGWEPKVTFKELVKIMMDADLEKAGLGSVGEGKKIVEKRFGDWHHV